MRFTMLLNGSQLGLNKVAVRCLYKRTGKLSSSGRISLTAFSNLDMGPLTVKSSLSFVCTSIRLSTPSVSNARCNLYAARAAPPLISNEFTIKIFIEIFFCLGACEKAIDKPRYNKSST